MVGPKGKIYWLTGFEKEEIPIEFQSLWREE